MAFNRTYYFDIRSNNNISYRLEIYDDVETTLLDKEGKLGVGGVKIKYGSEGSKMFAPLKPSTLAIDMMVTDIDAANYIKNLKTNRQERDVYVGLYRETVSGTNDPIYGPMWGGYLLMDLSSDPDEAMPYNIKLKCIDGLASLKHYDFIPDTLDQVPSGLYDKEDTYISNSNPNHRNFIDLISICLSKSGYFSSTQGSPSDPQFRTAVNWYNGEMANTTDDPLAKTRCKPQIFYEAETQGDDTIKYKAMNCYDVLVAICKAWGMRCFLWKNTWSFIQINQFEENQTGTQGNPDDIDNHTYNMGGALQSTSDSIQTWWSMYQLFVDNRQAITNVRNYKLSGGQYGTLPAFKQVTVDFLNVDNFNSFNGFPLIPLTTTTGAPTTAGTKYEFTSLGNFTFDGTTDQMFYQRIYLALTNNGTESGDFSTEWCMVARPSGTGTNTANTSPVNNGWTKYMYFDYTGTPQTHAWAPTVSLNWASWPCTGQYPIVPGNQTIDITTGTPYQFPIMPASTFTAGDWEIGYYVRSVLTVTTSNWGGHGRFNPTVYSANKNPWDYNIAYQNVAYGYGIGSSEFAPIVNGAVGSYSTTTSLVQTGDDTADEKVKDILFGDGFGGRGQVQIYTGTIWKDSDQSGIWGKDTLAGGNSMSQQLAQDIFSAQSKSLVEFTVATTLDPTESIYFNDGTANRPQFICPFTKINTPSDTASSTPARAYIMHTGEWNVIQDTWKWKLYEQMQSLGSITTTTTNTGGINSGNTGGAGIPVPTGGGNSAKMGNPALNNTLNTKLLQQKEIAPITVITEEQIIAVSGATGTYQQTITSLKVNALEEVINQGDKFILQTQSVNPSSEPVNIIEFEASSRAIPGATTIPVTSKTIYQNITIGDTITFNTSNLVSQYQNKTEGTIAGFDIDENGIAKSGVEITGWLNSDTMTGASVNNLPTALSVKNYVDNSHPAEDQTLQEVTDRGATTTNDIIGASITLGDGTTSESAKVFHSDGSYTEIFGYGLQMSRSYSYLRPTTDNVGTLSIGSAVNTWAQLLFHSATTIFNTEANGESMRITSAGNVGIGTTSPDQMLHISGLFPRIKLQDTDAANTLDNSLIEQNDGVLRFRNDPNYLSNNSAIQFDIRGAERMRITSAGNVGIGTTSPSAKLQVVGGNLRVDSTGSTADYSEITDRQFQVTRSGSSSGMEIETLGTYTGDGGFIDFNPKNANAMRIAGDGNVGIGTTSPGQKLEVNGNAVVTGNMMLGSSASGEYITRTGSPYRLGLFTNSAERISVINGGNVGIGTTSPSKKLEVTSPNSSIAAAFGKANGSTGDWTGIGLVAAGDEVKAGLIFEDTASYNRGSLHFVNRIEADNDTDMTLSDAKMSINNIGNVGIGTTSPTHKLDVIDSTSTYVARFRGSLATYVQSGESNLSGESGFIAKNSTGAFYVGVTGGVAYLTGTSGANTMTLGVGGAEKMRITSAGNVGIGTTNPTAKLESISPNGSQSSLRLGRGDLSNYWDFNHAGNDLRILNSAASGSNILFGVDAGGGIKNNNVGIGTASPTEKLHIVGDTFIDGGLKVNAANIDFTGLGTTDPAVAGRLWNDRGTLKISSGE